ncbi:N-acetylmuramic acid 6-phosphate etherase [Clostridium aestuarii]|uniref:N-acetylmuramic acid 6-phosphate etherase n=1 Tax=Clostridium aestuarii TaxID=338193 RepID=A0ABT4D3T0_9CLOT|nr:N-acetylmuramic acid 6-phosphate etherase [Clostridium aestuarii]
MDLDSLSKISTEQRNSNTLNIDSMSTIKIVEVINNEDKKVAIAVEKIKESIAKAIDIIENSFLKGGRLIYVGAGTSGRLGIIDASECPPTFGVNFEMVQGIIAGGNGAMFKAVEGAEDIKENGEKDLKEKNITKEDVICGIAASGRTPYVIGAMEYAKSIGAVVLCITMNPEGIMNKIADIPMSVKVGPEVIMGSTRMKAGTAQKLILNMLTTGAMIKYGKVYGNLMVDVQATNEKLTARAKRIVMLAVEVEEEKAIKILEYTNYDVKLAIMILKTGLDKEKSRRLLEKNKGYIQKAIEEAECEKA